MFDSVIRKQCWISQWICWPSNIYTHVTSVGPIMAPSDRLAFIAGTNSDSQMSSYDTQMTGTGSYLIQIDSASRCIPYVKPMEFCCHSALIWFMLRFVALRILDRRQFMRLWHRFLINHVKLECEFLTVHEQQHSFSLEDCSSFRDRK